MPAINFKKQFADNVKSGGKTQTIRAFRKKRSIIKGDKLHLYTGMRTKKCKLLGRTTAKSVETIFIDEDVINVGCNTLAPYEVNDLARKDGFKSIGDFRAFFRDTYTLPFHGQLIKWDAEWV